ncbi:MAG: alpha-beta hydrolase superfamily lysophospholipase [Candidatus Azotimanducaceae bacterium]|jgi:alpha-beta hydrolase superfamily lysophospholipase
MQTFSLNASDGAPISTYSWSISNPKIAVHIAHGMGEHAKRYDWLALELNKLGCVVYANDHRGHGITGQACLGYMGPDGWNRLLADAYELNQHIRQLHPNIPLVLLGHSMGSMMSQQYITRYGASIDGLVLSGSPGFKAKSRNPLPGWVLAFELRRHGPAAQSALMQSLLFGSANKPFDGPDATGFEWLSRDAVEVQKYVDDPLCGFVISTGSLKDLYTGSAAASDADAVAGIPKTLPIYVMSGTEDPVHSERADIERLLAAYTSAGLQDITVNWFEGGHHEMFNETNKDEVVSDLSTWLGRFLTG